MSSVFVPCLPEGKDLSMALEEKKFFGEDCSCKAGLAV
jgi:hypothetical protein